MGWQEEFSKWAKKNDITHERYRPAGLRRALKKKAKKAAAKAKRLAAKKAQRTGTSDEQRTRLMVSKHGIALRVKAISNQRGKQISSHWMFENRGRRVLDYWPSSGTYRLYREDREEKGTELVLY